MALLHQQFQQLAIQPLIDIDEYLDIIFGSLASNEHAFLVPLSKQDKRRQWYVNKAIRVYKYAGITGYKVVEYINDDDPSERVNYSDKLRLTRKSAKEYKFSGVSLRDGVRLKIYVRVSASGSVNVEWKREGYNASYFHVRSRHVQQILDDRS